MIGPSSLSQALTRCKVYLQIDVVDIAFGDAIFAESFGDYQHGVVSSVALLLIGRIKLLAALLVSHNPGNWGHPKDLACAEMWKSECDRFIQHKLFKSRQSILLAKNSFFRVGRVIRDRFAIIFQDLIFAIQCKVITVCTLLLRLDGAFGSLDIFVHFHGKIE